MGLPIAFEKIINEKMVEHSRIEFKKSFDAKNSLKTIAAFANDIDNYSGGYLIIGIEEKEGVIKEPMIGLNAHEIEKTQKELLRACKLLSPNYLPISEVVEYKGASVLVVYCPGGYDRPYLCPKDPYLKNSEKIYYIRKFNSTIEASQSDVDELLSLRNNIPFDDRINLKADMSDLKHPLLRDYLYEVKSNLSLNINQKSVEELAEALRIMEGPKEYPKPINVGLMFFNDDIERFFPYSRIEIVNIQDETGQGMEEKIFKGPIHLQLISALQYLKNNIIVEKVFKLDQDEKAVRAYNYPYAALEEFLCNAIYHRSYQLYEPVTVRIEKDRIEITSAPGLDRSIKDEDIQQYKLRSKRYRNRRIGDFLKELHLVEGRNTGIPTALKALKENGSDLPIFESDEERTYFSVIIPIHPAFLKDEKKRGKKTREELKTLIQKELLKEDLSENELYHRLGYKGRVSKTFKEVLIGLKKEGYILNPFSNSPVHRLKWIGKKSDKE